MSNTMNMQQLSLHFSNGPLAGQSLPITKSETRLGSDPHLNDLALGDSSVMPEHARIISDSNHSIIQRRDNQSTLIVNFQPVEYAILQDGDRVTIGQPGVSFTTKIGLPVSSGLAAQPFPSPNPSQDVQVPPFIQPAFPPTLSADEVFPSSSHPNSQLSFSNSAYAPQQALPPIQNPQPLPVSFTAPPLPVAYTETTRYLCAAAHLDEKFHRFALKTIVGEEHRAIGETYGIDSIPVLKVSYAAQKRIFVRDSMLLAILLVVMVLLIISLLPLFGLMHATPTVSPSLANAPSGVILLFQSTTFSVVAVAALFCFALGVLLISLITRHFSLHLHPTTTFLLAFLLFYWTAIPFFFLAWLAVAIELTIRYYGADATRLTKNAFNPANLAYALDPTVEEKAHAVFQPNDGNVVVYSGSTPFAGAGINIGGWSFSLDVAKGKGSEKATALRPKTFQVDEIYTYVDDALKDLDLESKNQLCGIVSFGDKLYVNGREIRNDMRFLREPFGRPYNQVSEQLIEQFRLEPTQNVRFYKCVRLTSWRGEMILSIFYRFVMVANTLYIETDYFLLPPLKSLYYEIDTIEPSFTMHKTWDILKSSFSSTAELWLGSPIKVFNYIFGSWLHDRRLRRTERSIKENPAFDYGTETSLREVVSDKNYRSYFQYLDKEMYIKIIERQLLESVVEFLDARNVDTSNLKNRQEMILNNGVKIFDDSLRSGNLAVDSRAKANILMADDILPGAASVFATPTI